MRECKSICSRAHVKGFHEDIFAVAQVAQEHRDTVGARIGQARRELAVRERQDITPTALARRLGVEPSTVLRWERDESPPDRDNIFRLAELLGVDPRWLLTGQPVGGAPNENGDGGRDGGKTTTPPRGEEAQGRFVKRPPKKRYPPDKGGRRDTA